MTAIAPTAPEPVLYDFRRPPWIGRDRRAVLDGIHARLFPALGQLLTNHVRQTATLTLREAVQVTFDEFRTRLSTPATAFIVPLPGDAGDGLVVLEPALAMVLVDRLFGGDGEPGERPASLTPLEQAVLGQLVTSFLTALRKGYHEVATFTPGAIRFEEIVERITVVDRHDRVYLLDFELQLGASSGAFSICLPAALLTDFVLGEGALALPPSSEPARHLVEAHLRAAQVPVVVRLPGFRIAARDGATLAPGQVLETNHSFHGNVELHVNGRRLFLGALGRHQGHVGLRVLAPVDSTTPTPSRVMRRTDAT
jgi:flagellar motor switch protein FliM